MGEAQRQQDLKQSRLAWLGLSLLFLEGAAVGLVSWALLLGRGFPVYVSSNVLEAGTRHWALAAAGIGGLATASLSYLAARRVDDTSRLFSWSIRALPVVFLCLLPTFLDWRAWKDHTLTFLVAVCGTALLLERTLRLSARFAEPHRPLFPKLNARQRTLLAQLPLALVVMGAIGYAAYFSFHTLAYHWNGHTSTYDLGIWENVVWHALHGDPQLKATPIFGPEGGSHLALHATFIAFVVAPIYGLAQCAENLLILQSVLLGAAGIPLFLFARKHIGDVGACILSLIYFLYPAQHGAHLYDFHFLTVTPFFAWWAIYALDAQKKVLATVFIILTLSVREDVAASMVVIGLYFVLANKSPKAGAALALFSLSYFLVMKMGVMSGAYLYHYDQLVPEEQQSFFGVLETVFANPWFTLQTLLTEHKLVYVLIVLGPVLFLPLRSLLSMLFLVPGFFFTLLATTRGTVIPPPIQLSFQYTAHWTTFVFPATAIALSALCGARAGPEDRRLNGTLIAMCFAAVCISYQFGAVFQHNTARAGFDDFKFGTSQVDLERRAAREKVLAQIPGDARVAASERIVPHLSNRPYAYALRTGVFDAQYIVLSFALPWTRDDDLNNALPQIRSQEFGVVDVQGPFALLKRGYPTDGNEALLSRVREERRQRRKR